MGAEGSNGRATVLVVDDDASTRTLLDKRLSRAGYAVVSVGDGAAALATLTTAEFEVALVDMQMPGLTGLDVVTKLKSSAAADVEVIIATAYADVDNAVEAMHAGAFDYLRKPFDIPRLLATVERAVERRRLHREVNLLRATEAIFAAHDAGQLPAVIIGVSMRIMNADDASLMVATDDHRLVLAYSHSLAPVLDERPTVALDDSVAGRVARAKKPALLSDLSDDPRFADLSNSKRVRSSIVYPLLVSDRLVGILNINRINNPRPFQARDLELAGALAGQVALAVANNHLLGELRDNVEALKKSQARLAQSERLAAIGFLAAGVAHEVNNPVAYVLANVQYVLGHMESLRRPDNTALVDELINALSDSSDGALRIRDIVQDMRKLAHPARGEGSKFDLGEAVRAAIRLSRAEIKSAADLQVNLDKGLTTKGHVGQLTQVFLNLIVNAFQAFRPMTRSDATQPRNRVAVTGQRAGDTIRLSVEDTGPGLSEDTIAHLFEPFFTTKPAGEGTGLGLVISKEIVQRHGGTIEVSSTLGQGTKFTVVLPSHVDEGTVENQPTSVTTPRGRLLVVDDDTRVLESLRRLLGGAHDVVTASSGTQALELLSEPESFDVVLCDVAMPDLNGIELYRRVTAALPDLGGRFVFVTGALAMDEVLDFATEVSCDVVEKPFDGQALAAQIAAKLGRFAACTPELPGS
jgi:two-component system, NtrC family, sensor kinase